MSFPKIPASTHLENLKVFFASFEYYRVTLNEVQTDVNGDIGLAWGFLYGRIQAQSSKPGEGPSPIHHYVQISKGSLADAAVPP
jgi:hypothetical protein